MPVSSERLKKMSTPVSVEPWGSAWRSSAMRSSVAAETSQQSTGEPELGMFQVEPAAGAAWIGTITERARPPE